MLGLKIVETSQRELCTPCAAGCSSASSRGRLDATNLAAVSPSPAPRPPGPFSQPCGEEGMRRSPQGFTAIQELTYAVKSKDLAPGRCRAGKQTPSMSNPHSISGKQSQETSSSPGMHGPHATCRTVTQCSAHSTQSPTRASKDAERCERDTQTPTWGSLTTNPSPHLRVDQLLGLASMRPDTTARSSPASRAHWRPPRDAGSRRASGSKAAISPA